MIANVASLLYDDLLSKWALFIVVRWRYIIEMTSFDRVAISRDAALPGDVTRFIALKILII